MLYELRIYQVVPGRMQAILNRFRDDTIRIFAKHDMKVTNFWIDADESKDRLYYVLEHQDAASREQNFQAFLDDSEWMELKERTEQNGPLHEKIDIVYMKKSSFFQID
ncbi:NIPSNAP family protein [Paenibacillus sp. Root444D2]|uniref:NIPSNAP family protein n=1 Tax=Paenibacillus sp. Root444D2 TaxID=1736538 RepID=UPI00070B7746|nr:NIPSNAP family protein [Paenibacillus sp. Root444D2]KQX68156.1 NIPSNAP family containing protein [Paenibacillus sp. Root444D2]